MKIYNNKINVRENRREQSNMDNPKKLATYGTQYEEKHIIC